VGGLLKSLTKAYLVSVVLITIGLGLHSADWLISLHFGRAALATAVLVVWWISFLYLKKKRPRAVALSFLLVNIFWWPLLYQTMRRILFMIEHGGMERSDGLGSPLAFLVNMVIEQIFFLPLTVTIVLGVLVIRKSRKGSKPEPSIGGSQ